MVQYIHRYLREVSEPATFSSWYGAQIGGLQAFPVIKNEFLGASASASTSVFGYRLTGIKCLAVHKDCGHFCLAFVFAGVVRKSLKPQIEPMADEVITQSSVEGLSFLLYICGYIPCRYFVGLVEAY